MSTSPRSDVIQWHDRSKIQLLEHIASLEKEVSIESQRATHYREQWQISILALKEQENTIRSLCENSRRYESDAEASKQRIKRLEEELERTKEDRNAIAKNTREPLLLKLDHANERISKLNDYVAALETAGDLMANELSYGYDVDMWNKAKEAKL